MASDQVAKRLANQYAIIRELNDAGPLRRTELSRRLGIRKSSITSIVGSLLAEGVLCEEHPGNVRSSVRLNHESFYVAAAYVLPGRILFGNVNLRGEITSCQSVALRKRERPQRVIERIVMGLRRVSRAGKGSRLGFGVADSGVMERSSGGCSCAEALTGRSDAIAKDALTHALGTDVCVANDVGCQLWSGSWFDGWARGRESVLYVGVSEGIGAVMLLQGQLVEGCASVPDRIGHIRAGAEGRKCSCGEQDCLATYCSVPAMIRDARACCPDVVIDGAEDLARHAVSSKDVGNVLDSAARRLARTLCGLLAVMNPAMLVVGVESDALSLTFVPYLERRIQEHMPATGSAGLQMHAAGDVEMSALRGVAGMVMDRAYKAGAFVARSA